VNSENRAEVFCDVTWQRGIEVSEEHAVSIFMTCQSKKSD